MTSLFQRNDDEVGHNGGCMLHYGSVSAIQSVNGKPPRVRVRIPACNNLRSPWLALVQPKTLADKVFWLPDIGEQVVVLLDSLAESGVVLGAIYSKTDTAPALGTDVMVIVFQDGTRIEYNRAKHVLTANVQGDVIITASGQASITAPRIALTGETTITGKLHVTDAVQCDAQVTTGALKVNGSANISGQVVASSDVKSAAKVFDYKGAIR